MGCLVRRAGAVCRQADLVFPCDRDPSGHLLPGAMPSRLVYIKSALLKDMLLAVRGYQAANPDFPYQSTADQFFDEDQFEAYRELGYHPGDRAATQIQAEL